jgi:hypothetical protein
VVPLLATLLAGLAALGASFNLYLLEDGNPLTALAYAASPAVRFSYDAAYLSALVSVGLLGALLAQLALRVTGFGALATTLGLAALIVLGGFGGLLVRQSIAFLGFLTAYAAFLLVSLLIARWVTLSVRARLGERAAEVLGGCAAVVVPLVANVVAVVTHTLALNPANHALFMQGQIGSTHFSALLIAMGCDMLLVALCLVSVLRAFWQALSRSR